MLAFERIEYLASPRKNQRTHPRQCEEISDEAFAESFTRLYVLIEELLAAGKLRAHPTYFECVTAMAFEYFAASA